MMLLMTALRTARAAVVAVKAYAGFLREGLGKVGEGSLDWGRFPPLLLEFRQQRQYTTGCGSAKTN